MVREGGEGRGGGMSQNQSEIIRNGEQNEANDQHGRLGQTIDKTRTACITFPESGTTLVGHTNKGCHRWGKAAEPNTFGGDPRTRNHTHSRTEFRLREARHLRKAQAELQHGTGDRDRGRGESVRRSDDKGQGALC